MATEPPPGVERVLTPLVEHPSEAALVTDFDGTLAPIVTDPAEARPVDGAVDALGRLARRLRVVAVVSGRPVSFLLERVGATAGAGPPGVGSIRLVGLYGLERATADGEVVVEPGVEQWRPVVDDAAHRLAAAAPAGVEVEPKGLTVTVHWRRAPDAAGWVTDAVETEVERTGLRAHPARMSLELRPPVDTDKGSVVHDLVAGSTVAAYFGDDLGDLPAFGALAHLRTTDGVATASLAAVDAESPPEVAAAADAVVEGPLGMLAVLQWLADAVAPSGG